MPSIGLMPRVAERRPRRATLVLAIATTVLGAGVPTHAADAAITWEPCAERFECGSVAVPRDHEDPDAGQLDILRGHPEA